MAPARARRRLGKAGGAGLPSAAAAAAACVAADGWSAAAAAAAPAAEADRAEDRADLVSLAHTAVVLAGGTLLLLADTLLSSGGVAWVLGSVLGYPPAAAAAAAGPAADAPSSWWRRRNSAAQQAIFAMSVCYYLYDSFHITVLAPAAAAAAPPLPLRRRRCQLTRRDWGFLLHHAICVAGLAAPLLTGRDGTIVLCGFVAGEFSNPPRLLANFCQRQAGRPPAEGLRRSLAMSLGSPTQSAEVFGAVHFALFIVTRVVCAHYIAHVVVPYATLTSTIASACSLLAFGALVTWDHLTRTHSVRGGSGSKKQRRWRGSSLP